MNSNIHSINHHQDQGSFYAKNSPSKLQINKQVIDADIHSMFITYSSQYFEGVLHNSAVQVEWSSKMTSCAGLTYLHKNGYSVIRLSKPLLKYRSLTELKETLIHEMIHAYLFIQGKQSYDDYLTGGHGQVFLNSNNIQK